MVHTCRALRAISALFDIDFRKNTEPALQERFGPPIIHIPDLHPDLRIARLAARRYAKGIASLLDKNLKFLQSEILSEVCVLQARSPNRVRCLQQKLQSGESSIAIHFPFLSLYSCKSNPFLWLKAVHTLPICITMRLPFASRYFCRSIKVRGRWKTPYSGKVRRQCWGACFPGRSGARNSEDKLHISHLTAKSLLACTAIAPKF